MKAIFFFVLFSLIGTFAFAQVSSFCDSRFAELAKPAVDFTLFREILKNKEFQGRSLTRPKKLVLLNLFKTGVLPGGSSKEQIFRAVRLSLKNEGLDNFRYLVTYLGQPNRYRYSEDVIRNAWPRIERAADPFSTESELVALAAKNTGDAFDSIFKFENLISGKIAKRDLPEKANQWVQSPERAIYLYQNIGAFGEGYPAVLEHLLSHNEYFKRAGRVRGPPPSLVTMSYEKETTNRDISLFYRDAKIDEAAWMKLSAAERDEKLRALITVKEGVPMPANVIAPTGLRPASAGGLRNDDGFGAEARDFVYEFTHKKFEFDEDRLIKDMKEIQSLLKESDFHVHLAFDLPQGYEKMHDFTKWLKQSNDFVYLQGMEEGMHANHLTKVSPPVAKPLNRVAKYFQRFLDRSLQRVGVLPKEPGVSLRDLEWPSRPEFIGLDKFYTSHKWRSIGLRSGIYGQSRIPDHIKVGIELRDASRNLESWKVLIKKFKSSLIDQVWESSPKKQIEELQLLPEPLPKELEYLKKRGFGKKFIAMMAAYEPTFTVPLKAFETGKVWDYRTGAYREADAAMKERVRAAREIYLKDLKNMEIEIQNKKAIGEKFAKDDVRGAVRMNMSEWAGRARVSSLFGGI